MLVVLVSNLKEGSAGRMRLPEPWRGETVLPNANPNPFAYSIEPCGYRSNTGATYNLCYLFKNYLLRELRGYVVVGKPLFVNSVKNGRKIFRDAEKELTVGKAIAGSLNLPVIIQVNNTGPHLWEAPKPTVVTAEYVASHYNLNIYRLTGMPRWLPEKLEEQEDKAKEEVLLIGKHVIYPAPFTPYLYRIETGFKRTHRLEYAIIRAGTALGAEEYTIVHPEHEKTTITLEPGYYLVSHHSIDGGYEAV